MSSKPAYSVDLSDGTLKHFLEPSLLSDIPGIRSHLQSLGKGQTCFYALVLLAARAHRYAISSKVIRKTANEIGPLCLTRITEDGEYSYGDLDEDTISGILSNGRTVLKEKALISIDSNRCIRLLKGSIPIIESSSGNGENSESSEDIPDLLLRLAQQFKKGFVPLSLTLKTGSVENLEEIHEAAAEVYRTMRKLKALDGRLESALNDLFGLPTQSRG